MGQRCRRWLDILLFIATVVMLYVWMSFIWTACIGELKW